MRLLTLDSETFDPGLKRYGTGSTFKYHYPEVDFEVLIFGYLTADGEKGVCDLRVEGDKEKLLAIMEDHDSLLFHNALYDMGGLKYLFREQFDLSKWVIYDTMLMAKLYTQQYVSYSLDSVTKNLGVTNKDADILHDYAWVSGIYQEWVSTQLTATGRPRGCRKRPSENVLHNWCMSDMRRFPDKILYEYCLVDIMATKAAFDVLLPLVSYLDLNVYSDVLKVCLEAKFEGLRIDLKKANELSVKWLEIAEQAGAKFRAALNIDNTVNINSVAQIAPYLRNKGYKIPKTDKGNDSIDADWLEKQPEEIFKDLLQYRKAQKAEKDYIQKLLQYQEAIPEQYREEDVGWLFPTMKPLGATATGRFTSGGGTGSLELNVLAISAHDEDFGIPIRELFIAHKDEKIVCCDFSNQEPRLQVHYAVLLGCRGAEKLAQEWRDDPTKKYHKTVAEWTKLDYDTAKMVTLGIAYDMRAAGLSVKLGISFEQATALMKEYHRQLPHISQLHMITSKNILKLGYIKTIGGRKLQIDKAYMWMDKLRTQERKGMSKLIQGSGADQTMKAIVMAWKKGLKVLLCVHDEIILSTKEPERDMEILQECMATAYTLVVPVVSDGGIGDNWLEAKT